MGNLVSLFVLEFVYAQSNNVTNKVALISVVLTISVWVPKNNPKRNLKSYFIGRVQQGGIWSDRLFQANEVLEFYTAF